MRYSSFLFLLTGVNAAWQYDNEQLPIPNNYADSREASRLNDQPVHQTGLLPPVVKLSYASVIGASVGLVDSFRGIPYAQPPVGKLRLKPPQPINSNLGTIIATGVPRSCPQFYTSVNSSTFPTNVLGLLANTPFAQEITDAGEDCLTINVQRPISAASGSKLPVVFWMFGGGFELGGTSTYDATEMVSTSIVDGKPIVYVSVNYRVGGFGFLGGKEILADGSSNIGLLDQRLGLQWVADNIAKFGGDPNKVTIWGESAGSISVFDQMALYNGNNTYKGKPLFRAGIMDSGSIVPVDPIDCPKAQTVYDSVVDYAGCSSAKDTLACLRSVNYTTFLNAANSVPGLFSYNSLALSYLPRPDGVMLTASPEVLAQNGKFSTIPFIIGNQEDEGTLFALEQYNLSTTDDLVTYLNSYLYQTAKRADIQALVDTYPQDPSAGSPYRTGALNALYPQYKRLAALQGDTVFTLTRRALLDITANLAPKLPTYSYLASYGYGTPLLGTFHATDIAYTYYASPDPAAISVQQYYINFINNMDPNGGGLPSWPLWSSGKTLLNFQAAGVVLLPDTFRNESYSFIYSNLAGALHT